MKNSARLLGYGLVVIVAGFIVFDVGVGLLAGAEVGLVFLGIELAIGGMVAMLVASD